MGGIREMLNTLGYGEFSGESTRLTSNKIVNDVSNPIQMNVSTPKGVKTDGTCAGCELSARYF